MARLRDARLQRRDLRADLLGRGACLLRLERGRQAGLHAPARDLQRLFLAGQVGPCNPQAGFAAAQRQVGQRHLGTHRHLHVPQAGGAGLRIQGAGVGSAAIGAEDVGLPARVEAGTEAVARGGAARVAALRRAGGVDARTLPRCLHLRERARLAQRGLGRGDIGVGGERLLDQGGQCRVVETLPPVGQRGAVTRRRRVRPGRRHGDARVAVGGRGAQARTAGQRQRGEQWTEAKHRA